MRVNEQRRKPNTYIIRNTALVNGFNLPAKWWRRGSKGGREEKTARKREEGEREIGLKNFILTERERQTDKLVTGEENHDVIKHHNTSPG